MVCGNSTSVCGWNELINGHLFSAVFTMWDAALGHWFVGILFFVYQFLLLVKTRNLTAAWTTGLFFTVMFATSLYVQAVSLQFMFILLALELGGIIYLAIWK